MLRREKRISKGLLIAGLILVGGTILLALAAPWITSYDPNEIDLTQRLMAPNRTHPLGTDQLGRDVLSRILYGARVSVCVGILAVGFATVIGIAVGTLAGYQGGWMDSLLMRGVDILMSFPSIFLILSAVAFVGPSIANIIGIIAVTGWMGLARLVRAEVLSLKEREFILAAKGIGASGFRIVVKHLLPNALNPILVNATLGVGSAILIESALSFLGIGVQLPTPSWGNILSEGKATLGVGWWLNLFPGLSIFTMILGCNLLGEGLRRRMRI